MSAADYYAATPGGVLLPSIVGVRHIIHDNSGSANVDMDWPGGTAAGDRGLLIVVGGNVASISAQSPFTALDSDVTRPSTTAGENMSLGILSRVFDAADITAGDMDVAFGSSYAQALLITLRNCSSLAWESSDALKSSGPQNANSMPIETPDAGDPCIAFAILAGGWSNAKASFAACTGWTALSTVPQFSNSGAAGRYGCQALAFECPDGSIPSGTITTSGSANAYLVSTTVRAFR